MRFQPPHCWGKWSVASHFLIILERHSSSDRKLKKAYSMQQTFDYLLYSNTPSSAMLSAMTRHLSEIAARMAASRTATLDDVLAIRRIIYAQTAVTENDASLVLSLDDSLIDIDPSWTELLIEVVCDFLVYQNLPEGYIDHKKAQWLLNKISANGFVKSDTELEVLIKVIEASRRVPHFLTAFALEQVKEAVLNGEGALARGGILQKDRVTKSEVALLRRILSASSGEANIAISRNEAEILFEIHEATRDADNDPEWQELFVQSLAHYLAASSLEYQPLPIPHHSATEITPTTGISNDQHISGLFSKMDTQSLEALSDAVAKQGVQIQSSSNGIVSNIATTEQQLYNEAQWLIERIMRDHHVSEIETKLLKYIQQDHPHLEMNIKGYIAKVA